ncbi:hypothetical protein [Alkalihalobacillus deserti]|uniref:hypothetical protein n=1 Tax=Alkalihalobacillus deserti TaxID=2879466 RepID=UPI001D14728C|nr:hypothetical protein [Alkalihalobacillus deserti]
MQNTINDIVKAFLKTPCSLRTNFETLKLISEYWSKLDQDLFDSDQHFIVTSAKVTDQLLCLLMSVKSEKEMICKIDISSINEHTN